jgi:hypothetical protein
VDHAGDPVFEEQERRRPQLVRALPPIAGLDQSGLGQYLHVLRHRRSADGKERGQLAYRGSPVR